jgi:hypothetical protein
MKDQATLKREFTERRNEKLRAAVNERMGYMSKADRIDGAGRYLKLEAELDAPMYEDDPGRHRSGKVKNVQFGRPCTVDGRTFLRHSHIIGFVPKGCRSRQAHGGELIEGPWAYAFGTGSMLTASRVARDIEIQLDTGDVVQINGVDFVAEWDRGEWLNLHRIEDDGYLVPNDK